MEKEVKKEREVIASMFNGIASKYDLLNLVLSFGIDTIWRARLIKYVMKSSPATLLDIASGTGDLALIFGGKGLKVTGADISRNMLDVASAKADKKFTSQKVAAGFIKPEFVLASADELPFGDKSYDAVTISFGIRNFENRGKALDEIMRVMNNGGVLAILEFASPKNRAWRWVYGLYLRFFVPFVGRIVSGDKRAYSYLPESISTFPKYEAFCKEISDAGFSNVNYRSFSGGIAVLYTAHKT